MQMCSAVAALRAEGHGYWLVFMRGLSVILGTSLVLFRDPRTKELIPLHPHYLLSLYNFVLT
jgi:hypothetical protein